MELYFLRHGHAVEPGSLKITADSERPLTPEGVKKMKKTALGMRSIGVEPGHIVSSPYLRARQTAELAAEGLRHKKKIRFTDTLTPGAACANLTEFLAGFDPEDKLLLVGHQPSIGNFITHFLREEGAVRIDVKKASLCFLTTPGSAAPGSATLRWFVPSRFLRELA